MLLFGTTEAREPPSPWIPPVWAEDRLHRTPHKLFYQEPWKNTLSGYHDVTILSQRRFWLTHTRSPWHTLTGKTERIIELHLLTYFSERTPSMESLLFSLASRSACVLYPTFILLMLTSITYASEYEINDRLYLHLLTALRMACSFLLTEFNP